MRLTVAIALILMTAALAKHGQPATTLDVMFAATMILLALSGRR